MIDDPERLVNQLVQCLMQSKKPLGFLLGAGCPCSIKDDKNTSLIPDIRGLTEAVKLKVCSDDNNKTWDKICDQLKACGNNNPNIEDILSRVRGLKEYAGEAGVLGLQKEELVAVEKRICEEIKKCVSEKLPNKATPYHNLASWISATDRTEPVEVFTTNYDLLMEQALEEFRVPFFDGFIGSCKPFFDPYAIEFDTLPARWARLWKIHGSINWRQEDLVVWRSDVQTGGDVVIHPSHLKYEQSRKMPYLAMMDRLKKFLNTPSSALIIVGYSFGDQHLNDVIVQGLQGTPSATVFALVYGDLTEYTHAVNLSSQRGNLSLIAKNGGIIGTKETLWKEYTEQPDSDSRLNAVEWSKKEGKKEIWQACFKLGDFASLGLFLQEISGREEFKK